MVNYLVAVLVPSTATVDTIDTHLAGPMRHVMPWAIDGYRFGGEFTGAWDPAYDPAADPANWRPCTACAATGATCGQPCAQCGDAARRGRPAGTVLAGGDDWVAHPGDLVPVSALLDPAWRFPTDYRRPTPTGHALTDRPLPDLWVDTGGVQWLHTDLAYDSTPDGELPPGLREVLHELVSGRRAPGRQRGGRVDPAGWQVAIVAGHAAPDDACLDMPVVGSIVTITDPEHADHDAAPGQLYVVAEDGDRPDYLIVRVGGGPGLPVPGYAITEIDPARLTLAAVADGTALYRPSQRHQPR